MYSGIAQAVVPIVSIVPNDGSTAYVLDLPERARDRLEIGASVAIEGVCLSAVRIEDGLVTFDVSDGTLSITNLGDRRVGDRVNLERSLRSGDENGGHNVTGHVSGTARIAGINTGAGALFLQVEIPEPHRRYVFERGFLALNGCSLTVAGFDRDSGRASINLIPETVRQTSFAGYAIGGRVNYEVELQTQIMVDTIERAVTQALALTPAPTLARHP